MLHVISTFLQDLLKIENKGVVSGEHGGLSV